MLTKLILAFQNKPLVPGLIGAATPPGTAEIAQSISDGLYPWQIHLSWAVGICIAAVTLALQIRAWRRKK